MHPKNEAASRFLAFGARRNDACDVSLVLVLGFSACVNTAKHGKIRYLRIGIHSMDGRWMRKESRLDYCLP